LPRAKGATGGRDLHRPFQQAAVQLLGDQPLTKDDQGAFAEGRGVAVQTVQHQLPPAIHGGGFDHFVIGDLRVRLEQGRQRQLGRGHWGMPLWLILIECCQLLLKGLGKQRMAVVPQEHKQLGPTDAFDDGVFRRGQFDWGMPQRWTHGKPSLGNGKKMMVSHAITSWKNTRPMF
jgi:hypothetical protein